MANPKPKHRTETPAVEVIEPTTTQADPTQDMTPLELLAYSCEAMAANARGLLESNRLFMQAQNALTAGLVNGPARPMLPAPTAATPAPAASTPAKPTPPPPKHRPDTPAPAATPAPAPAAATAPKTDGKVKPDERNYDNEISLVEAVWRVLDRKEHAEGLKVGEIVDVIEKEKIWESSSEDISNMVQGAVYKLKEKGKVVRGDNRRYYIPEGATPPESRKGGKKEEATEAAA
jgi:hypothetical protein